LTTTHGQGMLVWASEAYFAAILCRPLNVVHPRHSPTMPVP